jgi:hypothetical protein
MKIEGKVNLGAIQTLADELSCQDCPKPNFPIPEGCNTTGEGFMVIRDTESKGKGFFAKQDIKAGTIVLGNKPVSLVMGWEEDESEDEMSVELDEDEGEFDSEEGVMKGSKRNGMLIARVANAIRLEPSLWFDQITNLFPREASEELAIWMCTDAATGMEIEQAIDALSQVKKITEEIVVEIRQRLPLIVRYNCLSLETAPELFIHPNQQGGGHISLSGTGLYHYPSYFNHSHEPNVSRFAIGDVMFFVTNQDLKSGDELCISYIEAEHLCESPTLRSTLLDMDFQEFSSKEDSEKNAGGRYPIVDLDMQDELMSLNPVERLDELNELLTAATHGNATDASGGDDLYWFKCDAHQLRVLLALTFDSMGQSSKAMEEWKKCISFAEENLPPGTCSCGYKMKSSFFLIRRFFLY